VKGGNSGKEVIGQIVTVFDILPGTPEAQQRKLALLANIRKLKNDPGWTWSTRRTREQLEALDIPEDLHVLQPVDLPALARRPSPRSTARSGAWCWSTRSTRGSRSGTGATCSASRRSCSASSCPDEHKTLETSGPAVVFAAMIQSILQDWAARHAGLAGGGDAARPPHDAAAQAGGHDHRHPDGGRDLDGRAAAAGARSRSPSSTSSPCPSPSASAPSTPSTWCPHTRRAGTWSRR
jgi:hypothetical protein